jgi:hypothetical protein
MSVDNNLLQNNGFRLSVGGTAEFPKFSFFAIKANIPGVTMGEIATQYRNRPGFVQGETLKYESFTCTLACDERMLAYLEIFNWMKYNVTANKLKVSDITLDILNSHNNTTRTVKFTNAFPTSIDAFELDASATDTTYINFGVSFFYDEFLFIV